MLACARGGTLQDTLEPLGWRMGVDKQDDLFVNSLTYVKEIVSYKCHISSQLQIVRSTTSRKLSHRDARISLGPVALLPATGCCESESENHQ